MILLRYMIEFWNLCKSQLKDFESEEYNYIKCVSEFIYNDWAALNKHLLKLCHESEFKERVRERERSEWNESYYLIRELYAFTRRNLNVIIVTSCARRIYNGIDSSMYKSKMDNSISLGLVFNESHIHANMRVQWAQKKFKLCNDSKFWWGQ